MPRRLTEPDPRRCVLREGVQRREVEPGPYEADSGLPPVLGGLRRLLSRYYT
jgi:hypothetical protein